MSQKSNTTKSSQPTGQRSQREQTCNIFNVEPKNLNRAQLIQRIELSETASKGIELGLRNEIKELEQLVEKQKQKISSQATTIKGCFSAIRKINNTRHVSRINTDIRNNPDGSVDIKLFPIAPQTIEPNIPMDEQELIDMAESLDKKAREMYDENL